MLSTTKHIKSFKLFESDEISDIRQTITDICQDLLDYDGIRLVFQDLGGGYECVVIRVDLNSKQYLKIDDVEEELLRIKDYLGDKFITFKCRVSGVNQLYKPLDISNMELSEIEYFSFAVFYRTFII